MDKLAEKMAKWFGSAPFILFHVVWFAVWVGLHVVVSFDQDWSALTLIVSLEAIFLSLFILRAENVQGERFERKVKQDVRTTRKVLENVKSNKK
jgi:uncharacterized membrane protein